MLPGAAISQPPRSTHRQVEPGNLLPPAGRNAPKSGCSDHLDELDARVAHGGHIANHAVGLHLALHPGQASCLLLLGHASQLDQLPGLQLARGLLDLPRLVLRRLDVEARGQDGLLHHLEVRALLQEQTPLVPGDGRPTFEVVLHGAHTDPLHIGLLLLHRPLEHLHHLPALQAPERRGLTDADAIGDCYVLRHLHEHHEHGLEDRLRHRARLLLVQPPERPLQLLLRQNLRIAARRQPADEGGELFGPEALRAFGGDRLEERLGGEALGGLVLLERHGDLGDQGLDLHGVLPRRLRSELLDGRCSPLHLCVQRNALGLELLLLGLEPGLEGRIDLDASAEL
mmetsp:Transcript_36801/g.105981  ORF Transcript_36801/g.105981 Transcript_36801/m.105981 type:complete len:342 (+) Transcript_36801:34-1059(+)